MILVPCPYCGPRNCDEFRYSGQVRRRPDPPATTPGEWRDYLYGQANPAGWVRERWYHVSGCGRFLTVERHTVSNAVRAVVTAGSGTGCAVAATADRQEGPA